MEAGLTSLFEQVHLGFARRPRVMDGDQIPIPSARPTSCQVTIDTLRFWVIRSFRHRGLKRIGYTPSRAAGRAIGPWECQRIGGSYSASKARMSTMSS